VTPFRSRLFEPAAAQQRPIQPVAVYYRSAGASCRELAFIGEETFLHHLLRVLGEPSIDAYVRFCTPIAAGRNTDRREAAEQARQAVATALEQARNRGE
jgi:1-acyl-sn-glycerol-3-phosphate acyltransferase